MHNLLQPASAKVASKWRADMLTNGAHTTSSPWLGRFRGQIIACARLLDQLFVLPFVEKRCGTL